MELLWQCGYSDPTLRHHIIDNVFGSWINYARWLCDRSDIAPLSVDLEHAPPAAGNEAAYLERWRCPENFAQSLNRVRFSPDLLALPLRQPDPFIRQTLENHARERMTGLQADARFVTQVRHIIYLQLRQGMTRQDLVAEALAMTPRTLQRKLARERLSYQALLDETRSQLACEYLGDPALPLTEIALRLGFSDGRSFLRRFKSWTGMTPGHYRSTVGAASQQD